MRTLSLDGNWDLIERPLGDGADAYDAVAAGLPTCAATVPGDVNSDLHRSGWMPEPLEGLHARAYAERVPNRSWWYRRTFDVPVDATAECVELLLDGLDVHADVWLNGRHIGHHATVFEPFRADVTALVLRGRPNLLVVRLTTGRERVAQREDFPLLRAVPTEASRGYPERGFRQRVFLRKPAYTWGWDWSPALPTCGITAHCEVRLSGRHEIAAVRLTAGLARGRATVQVVVELQRHTLTSTSWGHVRVRLTDETGVVHGAEVRDVLLRSGLTLVTLAIDVPKPRLWWPNGSGPQHRYTVEASLNTEDQDTVCAEPFQWGLRTVELEVGPRLFRFRVNGAPLFIQGGNWVPCDHLYGRTTPARLEQLVAEAAAANFNCLRVWGGGRYELEAFYEACDRLGILLWHDFMSACAPLPYEEPGFAELCRREAVWQMRRLHNRACLLLWCGNNEVGGCYEWFRKEFAEHRDPAWQLYFQDLPRIAAAEAGAVPYWPTSPYGGSSTVNDLTVGDDHHWVVMRPDRTFWSHPEYWDGREISIFNSEYGYGGPCSLESTRAYLGMDVPDLFSAVGREHTNSFYDIPRVTFSIAEHYGEQADRPIEDYIRLGGLCQGLNLGYSLESLRANDQTWGGIFWMFDDAWGENGWTIIDYYLRRKISFYAVRRSLAPQKLVLRRGGQAFGGREDQVLLLAINDGDRPLRCTVMAGYSSYDGAEQDLRPVRIHVKPRAKAVVAFFDLPDARHRGAGTIMVRATAPGLDSVAWRHCRYREAGLPPANVRVLRHVAVGPDLMVSIATDCYAHAVHVDLGGDWRFSDSWFDLLPGERRDVRIFGGARLDGATLSATCINAP